MSWAVQAAQPFSSVCRGYEKKLNFPKNNPGRGSGLYQDRQGRNILILHAQGQDFMHPCDDPCTAVDDALGGIQMGRDADAILVDFHAEATSENTPISPQAMNIL